ncbi:MAG: hypothetical protein GVY16_08400 [Planctomycetes bacterium]|jgi:hypothetical protein|nr:hypothetical protein [Planctomycetota bacterium]
MLRQGAVLVVLLACCSLVQAETIDNPEYLAWAEFDAGASSTIVMVNEMGPSKTEMTMTHTLKSIDENEAVVETVTVVKVADNEMKQPPQKRQIPARIDKPAEPAEEDKPEVKEGEETVKVKAGTFKCKTVETHMKQDGKNVVTKVWTCPDVPGGQVKMTMKTDGENAMKSNAELVKTAAGGDDSGDDAGEAED